MLEKIEEKDVDNGKEVDKLIESKTQKPSMDTTSRLYFDLVMKEMQTAFTSGAIKEDAQFAYMESVLPRLLLINDPEFTRLIRQYFTEQDKIKGKIKEYDGEMRKAMEEYSKNAQEFYNELKKL